MLHKSFLPVITSWLLRRNRYILNTYYATFTNDSLHKKETINSMEMKESIEETGLKVKKKKSKVLQYIKQSILYDKETSDIFNYIQKVNPDIIDIIQSMKWKYKKENTNILYLIDKDTAVKFVSLIKNDLRTNMCYVAELNPGFGILTRELLRVGVPLIHLYEKNAKLYNVLEMICLKYPGKVNLIPRNSDLIGITRSFYEDKVIDDEKYQDMFKAKKNKNWKDETYMQVIGASDSRNLFTFIIHSLVHRNGFMFYGRPVFYIAILPSLWHVMFHLMFNYELLGTLNRKAFIPWHAKKRQPMLNQLRLSAKQDYEQMYVIKLEPKADLYLQLSQEDWITFSYFVRHHMLKRTSRVIPALEKWIPDCGIRLIAKDYTIYTQFADLTPTQILELFKEFKSWPEYKQSHFIHSMNNSLGAHNEIDFLNE
ncbi:dimethyladenosine transferase 2, mitochondrial-like isoform X2 [Monomorium pharaonis]|uniref:dimethyladenosine transferase 2, mitochondrial isoform X2 n=1 Tax=Monomorium pharaonis TaxID=307658 RepID=UPI00063F2DE5|nr:dimethyladenosine transferase 2, mitochondrial isoform X2 [Monomorium pharaonis]XP_036150946.1 dimethyladenosine transferase 2, mitochondrial-like isoform X2 [Monomorium pharaonis]